MPHMKCVKKSYCISYEALFITWRRMYVFSFRFDKLFPASRFMIRECHHQSTRMSAGSTTVLHLSLVHSCPRGIFVSAVCRRSTQVTHSSVRAESQRRYQDRDGLPRCREVIRGHAFLSNHKKCTSNAFFASNF